MAAGSAADCCALSIAAFAHAVDCALVRTRCMNASVPVY